MKVKDLVSLLSGKDPEAKVFVRIDGSIYGTDVLHEQEDYNDDSDGEFYVCAVDWFPDGE